MILDELAKQGKIQPPKFLADNTHYLTMMGSIVYNCSQDSSDKDVYGFCIPHKTDIFPHLRGEILGFGTPADRFNSWQQHHIKDNDTTWDIVVYSIVKYFNLLMDNSPNMLDSIMTPRNAVIHMTQLGQHVRDNRRIFVHKGCYSKFRGYAMSQMTKIRTKVNSANPKRAASIDAHGYDLKYAYHLVRLLLECEQLLETGDMDLGRDGALYRKVRAGEWSLEYLEKWFEDKEKHLEEVLNRSTIPFAPDEDAIKRLLLECLEMHFGSLTEAVKLETPVEKMLSEMQMVIDRYK
jgi:predicted nucleotidyltransferase